MALILRRLEGDAPLREGMLSTTRLKTVSDWMIGVPDDDPIDPAISPETPYGDCWIVRLNGCEK